MTEALQSRVFPNPLVHVAGMSRGGTTYLYHNLRHHPQIFVPHRKEICYFGHNYARGLDWFLDFYDGIGKNQTAIDICGLYFMDERSLDRILEFNPQARVILSLREPMKWIYSMYEHYGTIWDVPPLAEFIEGCVWHRDGHDIPLRFAGGQVQQSVERFRERLGHNLLILDFELLAENPLRFLQSIEFFLGIDAHFEEGNFSKARVKERGRQSAKMISSLSRLPGLDTLMQRVPRRVLMRLRQMLESAKPGRTEGLAETRQRPTYSDDEQRFVETALADDQRFVLELFERAPVWIGREPLDWPLPTRV